MMLARYFLILTLLLVAMLYLIPIAATGVLVVQTASIMDRVGSLWSGPISPSWNSDTLWKTHRDLLDYAALPGEPARNNIRLNVALIDFKFSKNIKKTEQAGYINITYNVKDIGHAANLIYTSGPLNLKIQGQEYGKRGKLAFEGRSPVRVTGLRQGFIAGVSFDGIDTFKASTSRSIYLERPQFCRSLKAWANFFELSPNQVEVWEIILPVSGGFLKATSSGFEANNEVVTYHGNALSLCKFN